MLYLKGHSQKPINFLHYSSSLVINHKLTKENSEASTAAAFKFNCPSRTRARYTPKLTQKIEQQQQHKRQQVQHKEKRKEIYSKAWPINVYHKHDKWMQTRIVCFVADQLYCSRQTISARYITKRWEHFFSVCWVECAILQKEEERCIGSHGDSSCLCLRAWNSSFMINYYHHLARSRSSLKHIFVMEGASQLHFASFVSRARKRIIVIIWVCWAMCVCERVRKIVWISRRRRSSLH